MSVLVLNQPNETVSNAKGSKRSFYLLFYIVCNAGMLSHCRIILTHPVLSLSSFSLV